MCPTCQITGNTQHDAGDRSSHCPTEGPCRGTFRIKPIVVHRSARPATLRPGGPRPTLPPLINIAAGSAAPSLILRRLYAGLRDAIAQTTAANTLPRGFRHRSTRPPIDGFERSSRPIAGRRFTSVSADHVAGPRSTLARRLRLFEPKSARSTCRLALSSITNACLPARGRGPPCVSPTVTRIPFEFRGLGRGFREQIADADELAVRTTARVFRPWSDPCFLTRSREANSVAPANETAASGGDR